ncbi:nuclear transport factor 2 family protein [Streptomyces sp. CA-181903]|uniref:nuclear transport factor 2 family protein n=1 Tax=Streptomyces sp. CA-181903 TaxID=3240055 RepID=UPI003D904B18
MTGAGTRTGTGTGPEDVVARFFAAWDGLDAARLASFFAEDGTYHSMPLPPVVGRDRIHAYFTDFLARFTAADFTVHHQASSETGGGEWCSTSGRT